MKGENKMELGEVQERFARIIWEKAPISSGELVKICDDSFGWKKSTTYTVLKKLCEKGLFENENGTVKVLMTMEEYQAKKSEEVIDEYFEGSLPAFIAAFTNGKKVSEDELEELQKLIDEMRRN